MSYPARAEGLVNMIKPHNLNMADNYLISFPSHSVKRTSPNYAFYKNSTVRGDLLCWVPLIRTHIALSNCQPKRHNLGQHYTVQLENIGPRFRKENYLPKFDGPDRKYRKKKIIVESMNIRKKIIPMEKSFFSLLLTTEIYRASFLI